MLWEYIIYLFILFILYFIPKSDFLADFLNIAAGFSTSTTVTMTELDVS